MYSVTKYHKMRENATIRSALRAGICKRRCVLGPKTPNPVRHWTVSCVFLGKTVDFPPKVRYDNFGEYAARFAGSTCGVQDEE
ncbi:hypothetical protein [Oscillospiraceae bacterium]|nr:hypothetical protein [Oscillospiraceae bacterium]